jgi:hypothetical protein
LDSPVTSSACPPLSWEPDEPGQILRLNRFRAQHPGIAIGAELGYWQALLPARDGEIVITRYQLKDLLDRLDTLTGSQ